MGRFPARSTMPSNGARSDVFEAFLGDQTVDVRLRRLTWATLRVGEGVLVDVLLGDGVVPASACSAPAPICHELGIVLSFDAQVGARLHVFAGSRSGVIEFACSPRLSPMSRLIIDALILCIR